jgi:hypothetical protein
LLSWSMGPRSCWDPRWLVSFALGGIAAMGICWACEDLFRSKNI